MNSSHITLSRRPAPLGFLLEDRDTGSRMTEAAYAEAMRALALKERRRPVLPPGQTTDDISGLAGAVMGHLADNGPQTVTEIVRSLGLPHKATANLLTRIVGAGWLSMEASPRPNRQPCWVYAITAAGLAKVKA